MDADRLRAKIDSDLTEIKNALAYLKASAAKLDTALGGDARLRIEARKAKLLKDRNLIGDLGFNLKERAGSPRTYAAPAVRRKIAPAPPAAAAEPYKPEPILPDSDYENILVILERMVEVMECSPNDFAHMGEETLRSHFLVQLNAQYEGQATGETFNYEGKTDILVKSEGRNVFVAECKFWRGAKQHIKTIDQLLGYLSLSLIHISEPTRPY